MNLYLLRPVADHPAWNPWYDKTFGVVVRARSPREARKIASGEAGDEGRAAWLDATATTCRRLTGNGAEGVVLKDFASA